MNMLALKKYGYLWVTLSFFFISLVGHWVFSWFAYVDEQQEQSLPIIFDVYIVRTMRDTLENWQSEFLQLVWQVVGLAFLLFVGSPQSKEGEDRIEEKIDFIVRKIYPEKAEKILEELRRKYPKK